MGEDENGTLNAIKAHRAELISPKVIQYGGRSIKLMGDGELFEFPSIVEAVKFAIEVQSAMRERNQGVAENKQIVFRIGVNIGDVIIEGDDIYGDGVNIASRLEGLSPPGGICLSNNVYNQIRDKLDVEFDDLGEVEVKNIARPIQVFCIPLNEKTDALVTPTIKESTIIANTGPERKTLWMKPAIFAVAVVLLPFGVIGYWQMISGPETPVVTEETPASIIVLPFDDLSPDKSLSYFADGMTEDITTELARWRELQVVARNSAFTYKGKSVDVRSVAKEMGVKFVLEGSIRKAGDKIRINAQLIDGKTGNHVWADKFDESGSDVLDLQDQITGKLAAALSGNVGSIKLAEYRAAWEKSSASLEEYDYYLRGHELFYRFTPQDNVKARKVWEEGLAKFPNSGLLKIKLGWSYMVEVIYGWTDDRAEAAEKASNLVEEGLTDEKLPPQGLRFGLWLKSAVELFVRKDCVSTMQTAKNVTETFPFDPEGLTIMGSRAISCGALDLAEMWIERGLNRSINPSLNMHDIMGNLRYQQERYDEAIDAYLKAIQTSPVTKYMLAASYAEKGETDLAQRYITELKQEHPEVTPDYIRKTFLTSDKKITESIIGNLAKVGWPD